VIQLQALRKLFGQRVAVDSLDLVVPQGVVFGLLGHNGAGKSTTIGMLLGQVWPTSGQLLVRGFDVIANRTDALAKVGAIFEAPVFYDYLSGWRNLEILASYSARTPTKRLRDVVAWVGLSGREHSLVRTYSHGMRARLALAQSLLPAPDLLILDEPTNGLDPEGIHEMRETIRRLHAEFGLTILLSSHLLSEVEQLCTRIAVLHQGTKVFDGSLAEATRGGNRVRLVTENFPEAAARLQNAALVTGSDETEFMTLATGSTTAIVAKQLVEWGFPVHAIAREESTLEQFYLSLVKKSSNLR
jgi:ABC-2 type transport system ATP-binding protein